MTAEEVKAKRLALGFRSRNSLAQALGVSKYAVEHWEYGRRAVPGWAPRFLQCLEHLQPGWPPESTMDWNMGDTIIPTLAVGLGVEPL